MRLAQLLMMSTLVILILISSGCYAKNTAQATEGDITEGLGKISVPASELYSDCPEGYMWNRMAQMCEESKNTTTE